MTHKKEYDEFLRSAAGKTFPAELGSMFRREKLSLFGMWLDAEKDWKKVTLTIEQSKEKENISRKQWTAHQARDLEKVYGDEWPELKQKREAAGLYYQDDDFPDNPQDILGYLPT